MTRSVPAAPAPVRSPARPVHAAAHRDGKGPGGPAGQPTPGAAPDGALPLDAAALTRVCRGALRERLSRSRGSPAPNIPDDMPLVARQPVSGSDKDAADAGVPGADGTGSGPVDLDSLELLEVVADLDRRFGLSRTGVEDHLLLHPTLAAWGRLVAEHVRLSGPDLAITFTTSGSQGVPRNVAHPAAGLAAEVEALLEVLAAPVDAAAGTPAASVAADAARRVVALVPCHHIFGFLFGALLPARAGWPVVDLAGRPPGALARMARPGDLVVATPHLLSLALEADAPLPDGLSAVVSGAPAPADLWARCARCRIHLIEVYGATETGGIGWRREADAPFALLPHLSRDGTDVRGPSGAVADLQDRLDWRGPRSFAVTGRLDRVVQVAGVNVCPEAVARHLAAEPGVVAATVRLDAATGRLKAFVVPEDARDRSALDALEGRLRSACTAFPAPARPQRYDFGSCLPTGPSGKPSDW